MFIWGTPILSKCEGRNFNEKAPSSSTSNTAIPCWKWLSISGKCPLLSRPLGIQLLLKKLAVSSRVCLCVTNTMCSLIDRNASENTEIFVVRIQRQHSLPVSNRIGQTPRSDAKWCLRVLAGPWWFSPLPWGALRAAILCYGDLCFRPGDGFVLVLPSIASLPPVVRTRGFLGFYNKPSRPPSRSFKADSHSYVCDYKTVSHSFFNLLERLCGQILVHIPTNRSFSEYSAPLFFNLPGKF